MKLALNTYSFETTWKLNAPVNEVWDVLYDTQAWPTWWKGVKKVTVLDNANGNAIGKKVKYTWKSILPYTLCFDIKSTFVDEYFIMEGVATGELEGRGVWRFTQVNNITTVKYNWDVCTTKKWMNFLSPILKPFFRWNHNIVMMWGAKGLAKKLNTTIKTV
ncbi:MAG: SRPBCC family protein [Ferruginibacter sp.]|nr:SRPBCC family protein [Ferruginibacter sp.]